MGLGARKHVAVRWSGIWTRGYSGEEELAPHSESWADSSTMDIPPDNAGLPLTDSLTRAGPWTMTAIATVCCTIVSGCTAAAYDFLFQGPNATSHLALAILLPLVLTPLFGWFTVRNLRGLEYERANSRQLAEAAERERRHLDDAVNNMPIGLVMFDKTKRLIVGNDKYREMYGLPHGLMQRGTNLRDLLRARLQSGSFEGTDREEYIERILKLVEQKETGLRIVELDDGRSISIIHHPIEGGGWVGTHEDVSDRRRAEARIHHMARHDALTDLPNRNLFKEKIEQALAHAEAAIAVLCLDLDRFKQVNDTLGHPVGDALLKLVAARLSSVVRHTDTIARFGGDEFAVTQVAVEQPAAATKLAERMVAVLGEPYEIDGHHIVIGASVGVAVSPGDGTNSEQLLKNADLALYCAKSEGRGRACFFEPGMDSLMQTRRVLELDLRHALREGQFEVHYQPIVDIATNTVTCFEALLRWRHPHRGLLLPAEFLSLAEEIGVIVPLGAWVLRQACEDAATWRKGMRVAVNVSPMQFRHTGLVEVVLQALATSSLEPDCLELEITEGVLLIEQETTMPILRQLHGLGVRIAMDDFGTGYSSMGYLRTFPFDKIKIDRSFVANMATDASSMAIIRAVTGLSRSLGITITAEGVETEAEYNDVRVEGCTEVQGFLFGRAVSAAEIPLMLRSYPDRSSDAA